MCSHSRNYVVNVEVTSCPWARKRKGLGVGGGSSQGLCVPLLNNAGGGHRQFGRVWNEERA